MEPLPSTSDKMPAGDKFDTIVELQVGEDLAKSFFVHKGVITFYSGYFRAALNGNFSEAAKGIVELPTEEVEVVQGVVTWLYTRKMPESAAESEDNFEALIKLWTFGDRRQMPLLANEAINAVRDELVQVWMLPTPQMRYIYENTTAESGLRRLVIKLIGATTDEEELRMGKRDVWPADALWDLLLIVWKKGKDAEERLEKDEVKKLDLCEYHCHEQDVKCPKKDA